MCKPNNNEIVRVKIPADLSHKKKAYYRNMPVDKCIAPIVRALQKGGIDMRFSCCGHGGADGEIHLQDGRILIINQPLHTKRTVSAHFN
jgi:hypothetical protein